MTDFPLVGLSVPAATTNKTNQRHAKSAKRTLPNTSAIYVASTTTMDLLRAPSTAKSVVTVGKVVEKTPFTVINARRASSRKTRFP